MANLIQIEFDGRSQTIIEWANELHITEKIIRNRLSRGWTVERVLSESPSVSPKSNPLTDAERERIAELKKQKVPTREISKIIGRSTATISYADRESPHQIKKRKDEVYFNVDRYWQENYCY